MDKSNRFQIMAVSFEAKGYTNWDLFCWERATQNLSIIIQNTTVYPQCYLILIYQLFW